jgi:hypothetical protein
MTNRYALAATVGLIATLTLQSVHMLEHVAQVLQKFVLRQPEAHGLLGAIFDFEWVHFVFNTSLGAALVLIFFWCRRAAGHPLPLSLRAVVWLQGYHVVEHVVKMLQYYVSHAEPTKGILGFVFPVIWLHFWINMIVLALIVVLIVGDWDGIQSHAQSDLAGVFTVP